MYLIDVLKSHGTALRHMFIRIITWLCGAMACISYLSSVFLSRLLHLTMPRSKKNNYQTFENERGEHEIYAVTAPRRGGRRNQRQEVRIELPRTPHTAPLEEDEAERREDDPMDIDGYYQNPNVPQGTHGDGTYHSKVCRCAYASSCCCNTCRDSPKMTSSVNGYHTEGHTRRMCWTLRLLLRRGYVRLVAQRTPNTVAKIACTHPSSARPAVAPPTYPIHSIESMNGLPFVIAARCSGNVMLIYASGQVMGAIHAMLKMPNSPCQS